MRDECKVSQLGTKANDEFHHALDELADRLTGEGTGPDGRLPDGTVHDFDYTLLATVETAPDGRRYIVEFRNGQLQRVKEVIEGAA